ncbi:YybH family protein [Flagellimonas meishanensis]|uniref:YybH family protein n=1 Tax=Flagellimonas meishanensis TaxID=2873264 RepID=UPI001CA6C315|nr:DUF4440 domain-containing protein [[Muricauda] meishanensis]
MKILLSLLTAFLLVCCSSSVVTNDYKNLEKAKVQVLETERGFYEMAREKGLREAFLAYADSNAVLNRQGKAIKGKEAIREYFENQTLQNVSLQWRPEFVDVSKSGDMAYTYGPFTFKAIKPDSTEVSAEGIFHTVWKKQNDGSWKYVYD